MIGGECRLLRDLQEPASGDPSARTALDPVSGNKVDMAAAVVGVDKAGNIYFFESIKNLNEFRVPAKK